MSPCFLGSFLPTPRFCGKELLSKTILIFILCITLDWRLQASVYCHWISDVVCFATCHLNVSSHTRKGSRLGKFSCILCFALLQNRVLINGCLRSWFFITRIFNMSLFCPHSSILLQFNVSCLQGRLSLYFRFFFLFFFTFFQFCSSRLLRVLYEENSTYFSLIRQTESKDTPTLTHGLAEVSTKHSFKH